MRIRLDKQDFENGCEPWWAEMRDSREEENAASSVTELEKTIAPIFTRGENELTILRPHCNSWAKSAEWMEAEPS
jgi:hypothetical protein